MGCMNSKPSYIADVAGGEKEYQERFLESKTLGEGEFGVVKLVHDVKAKDLVSSKPLAVKYLRKGFTFKDNTLYSPLKKEVLQGEVEILRQLNGEVRSTTRPRYVNNFILHILIITPNCNFSFIISIVLQS